MLVPADSMRQLSTIRDPKIYLETCSITLSFTVSIESKRSSQSIKKGCAPALVGTARSLEFST